MKTSRTQSLFTVNSSSHDYFNITLQIYQTHNCFINADIL